MKPTDTLLEPWSDSLNKRLEFPDSYSDNLRWQVPDGLMVHPVPLRWDIMYAVHAILENIEVDQNERDEAAKAIPALLEYSWAWEFYHFQARLRNRQGTH